MDRQITLGTGEFLDELVREVGACSIHVVIVGDFNLIRRSEDKRVMKMSTGQGRAGLTTPLLPYLSENSTTQVGMDIWAEFLARPELFSAQPDLSSTRKSGRPSRALLWTTAGFSRLARLGLALKLAIFFELRGGRE
jgi:hypothetical protein